MKRYIFVALITLLALVALVSFASHTSIAVDTLGGYGYGDVSGGYMPRS